MYCAVEEVVRCSGAERCLFSRFTSASAVNLFTAVEDQLRLYQIIQQQESTVPKLLYEEKLFGHVVDMVSIPGELDLVLISFKSAKAVLLKWSQNEQRPIVLSMHYFERDQLQSEFLENNYDPFLSLELSCKCAAMRVYKDNIAFIPVREEVKLLEEELYSTFVNSFVVSLAKLNRRIKNLIKFAFLPGYVQPTLALLYEPELTFVGRYTIKKDPCELSVISIDLLQKTFTTLFTIDHLPDGCFSLLPLAKPVGGLLVVCPDGIMHVDQGYSGYAMAVNGFATRSNSTNFRYKKNNSALELDLANVQMIPINPFQIACFFPNSSCYWLTLTQEGKRFVTGMELRKAEYELQPFIPSSLCIWNNWIFIGCRLSDSVLIECSKRDEMDAKTSKLYGSNDDIDVELFGTSSTPHAVGSTYSLNPLFFIPTYGPIRDAVVGLSSSKGTLYEGQNSSEFALAIGKDACGAVCFLNSYVKPIVRISFQFPACCNVWSFPCPNSPFDRYLMLSTTNSTLIMELKDDEFNELPVSDFYLEGVTLFASTIVSNLLIVQVYKDGFRFVTNDSSIKTVFTYGIENVFQIKSAATLNDSQLFVLFENGSFATFSVSVGMESQYQITQLDCDNIFASFGEINCFACVEFKNSSLLCFFSVTGALYFVNAENGELIFQDSRFYLFFDISTENSDSQSAEYKNVIEMRLVALSSTDELFLIIKNDFAQTVSYKVNLKNKILIKQKASFFRNSEFTYTPGLNSIVPLRLSDKSSLQTAVISLGKNSSCIWSISTESQMPRMHNFLFATKKILCLTSHHSALAKDGMIFLSDDGYLNIAYLDLTFNYNNSWPIKKVPIEKDVCFMDFNLSSSKYILATGIKKPFTVPPIDDTTTSADAGRAEEKDDISNAKHQTEGKFLPHFDEFTLELYSSAHFEKIDSFPLRQYEIVTGCRSTILSSRQSSSGRKEFLIVSSTFLKGEDRQIRGRFMLFDVIPIVPDPMFPYRTHKLKQVLSSEQKGPVNSFTQVNGYLLVSVGTKVMMFAFDENDDEAMEAIAFLDVGILSTSLTSLKNYFFLGDIYRSGMFCVWQEEPPKLILLGQDGHKLPIVCVEFMLQAQSLFLVASDVFGNIHIFSYAPNNLMSNAGTKLVKKGQFHVGTRVVKFIRFSLSDSTQGLYYFGQDGSIGVLFPTQEKLFKRVQSIFHRFLGSTAMPLGLNAKAHRMDLQNESSALVHNFVTRSVLDCDLINHFCCANRVCQRDTVHFIGTSVSKIFTDFEELFLCYNNA